MRSKQYTLEQAQWFLADATKLDGSPLLPEMRRDCPFTRYNGTHKSTGMSPTCPSCHGKGYVPSDLHLEDLLDALDPHHVEFTREDKEICCRLVFYDSTSESGYKSVSATAKTRMLAALRAETKAVINEK